VPKAWSSSARPADDLPVQNDRPFEAGLRLDFRGRRGDVLDRILKSVRDGPGLPPRQVLAIGRDHLGQIRRVALDVGTEDDALGDL
jgi:hypothetical protein